MAKNLNIANGSSIFTSSIDDEAFEIFMTDGACNYDLLSSSTEDDSMIGDQNGAIDDEINLESVRILKGQMKQLRLENNWKTSSIDALRTEVRGDRKSKIIPSIGESGWSSFLYDWRRKFGEWGKRVLDVSKYENDQKKAAHLLVEIYRRRHAMATCKAYIRKFISIDNQDKTIDLSKSDTKNE